MAVRLEFWIQVEFAAAGWVSREQLEWIVGPLGGAVGSGGR